MDIEKFKDGVVCASCGFDPEKTEDETNRLTILSLLYAKSISCLKCAIK